MQIIKPSEQELLASELPWTGDAQTRADLVALLIALTGEPAPDLAEPASITACLGFELPASAPRLLTTVGKPGTGKDVLADYMQVAYAGVARMAFSDVMLAEANAYLAVQPPLAHHRIHLGNKSHSSYRSLLQLVGTIRRQERENYWVDQLRVAVAELQAQPGIRQVHLTGARVESDIDFVRSIDGLVGKVYRPGNPYTADAAIERALDHVPDSSYDFILHNNREGNFAHYLRQVERRFGSTKGGTSWLARLAGHTGDRFAWGCEQRVRLALAAL